MAIIETKINTNSQEFIANDKAMRSLLGELHLNYAKIVGGSDEKSRKKHRDRGKMFVRDRINTLIDIGSDFFDLSPFAAYKVYDDFVPSAGIITGIGRINGLDCMIIANDATVKGGTYYPLTVKKHLRAQAVAVENSLPCIYLVDSGELICLIRLRFFQIGNILGGFFLIKLWMSSIGIPQIAVVMGSCTAGGAYIPAMADETIIVKDQGTIFLAGPPLVKAATGEETSPEALGGGDVHTRISGVADHLAKNDKDALMTCRSIVARLNKMPSKLQLARRKPSAPAYATKEIYGVMPSKLSRQFNVTEVIARIVDNSEFETFKERYGRTLCCGFAYIEGWPVGIIANDGILFSDSAKKGAHFVEPLLPKKDTIDFFTECYGFYGRGKSRIGRNCQGWSKTGKCGFLCGSA